MSLEKLLKIIKLIFFNCFIMIYNTIQNTIIECQLSFYLNIVVTHLLNNFYLAIFLFSTVLLYTYIWLPLNSNW